MGKSAGRLSKRAKHTKPFNPSWKNQLTDKFLLKVGCITLIFQLILYFVSYFVGGNKIFDFMFIRDAKFDDLANGIVQNDYFFSPQLLEIKGFSQVASPPMIFMWDIYRLFVKTDSALLLSLLMTYFILIVLFWFLTRNYLVTFFLMTLHPILFVFARGNPDMWVIILTCIAGFFMFRWKPIPLAIVFGLMGALKFPYLIFGLIFLLRKDMKSLLIQALTTVFVFLLPLNNRPWGTFEQIRVFNGIVANYFQDYVIGDGGTLYNVSLFGLEKSVAYLLMITKLDSVEYASQLSNKVVVVHLFSIVILTLILVLIPFISYLSSHSLVVKQNQVSPLKQDLNLVFFFLLVMVVCMYPQISAEYRLAQMVISVGLLYRARSQFLEFRSNIILLMASFLPKHFFQINYSEIGVVVTLSSFVTPILIIVLMIRAQLYLTRNSFYSDFLRGILPSHWLGRSTQSQ
jgi:hypothetical protein